LVPPNEEGVSIGRLVMAAKRLGLPAAACAVDVTQLERLSLPVIAYVRKGAYFEGRAAGHFVVISCVGLDKVQVINPSFGPVLVPRSKLAAAWHGKGVLFEAGLGKSSTSRGRTLLGCFLVLSGLAAVGVWLWRRASEPFAVPTDG